MRVREQRRLQGVFEECFDPGGISNPARHRARPDRTKACGGALTPSTDPGAPAAMAPPPAAGPAAATSRRNQRGGSTWRTWTGAGLALSGLGLLGWGAVWIAVDGNDHCGSTGGLHLHLRLRHRQDRRILAGAGAAATVGGAILMLTGGRKSDRDIAVGLTRSSFLLRARF